ncbi:MAG: hypothetical protein M3Y37_00605, partial [Chloroflexota bacterium]|nr:hypothetical protein [Chloroflexota bacterium]
LIPVDPDLTDALLFAVEQSSGFWAATFSLADGDLVLTAEVWGYPSLESAEAVSGRMARQLRDAARAGTMPIVLGPDFAAR